MKLPYSWLKELVKTNLSAKAIAEKLTLIGLEVESVEGGATFDRVIVGEILEVKDHPNADKLHLTKVNVGLKDPLEIVCGANNLSVGIKVPVVLIGGHVAGFEIKKANLRGVDSHGMICSEKELGLGDDHTGILILDKKARVGQDFSELASLDTVIDVNIPANRPDCMGVIGLARETAAALDEKLNLPEVTVKKELKEKTSDLVEIEILDKDLCPRYVGWVVKNVKIAPSPDWLANRLIASGVRPINNVVDISNYVMLETGQPLHFFDLAKLKKEKDKTKIIIRRALKGEAIKTLDGKKRELDQDMLVIADKSGAIAVAGVMGGENSEVDKTTTDILIEAAVFEKASIRKTARKLGLRSEAVARFEKGLPETLPIEAIKRAAQLLNEVAEGMVTAEPLDVLTNWVWQQHLGLSNQGLTKFLNLEVKEEASIDILTRLGFKAEKFDIVNEAKKHLSKPYLFGANYRANGTDAFDCSYLTDYLYSLINIEIGHTALAQIHHGWEVKEGELKPGDLLFYKGLMENSAIDHYTTHDQNGNHLKVKNQKYPSGVGHVGLYIGENKVIHAASYSYENGEWQKKPVARQVVEVVDLEYFTKNPDYLEARRYLADLTDYIAVDVPWWREDVRFDEDLYEEVARIIGYDQIPSTLPDMRDKLPKENTVYQFNNRLRHLLSDLGLTEILTYPFVTEKEISILGGNKLDALKLANPRVKEQEYLRLDLVSSMLKALSANQYNEDRIEFFEIGRGFKVQGKKDLPKETTYLCLGIKDDAGKGFMATKGVFERLLAEFKEEADYLEIKDGQAEIKLNGKSIGFIKEIESNILDSFGFKRPAVILEVEVEKILNNRKPDVFKAISKFPVVIRDISAIFDHNITVKSIYSPLVNIDNLIKKVEIIDIFEGKPLAKTEKSVTIRLHLQSDKETLTDVQVEKVVSKCQNKINTIGGTIRSGRE